MLSSRDLRAGGTYRPTREEIKTWNQSKREVSQVTDRMLLCGLPDERIARSLVLAQVGLLISCSWESPQVEMTSTGMVVVRMPFDDGDEVPVWLLDFAANVAEDWLDQTSTNIAFQCGWGLNRSSLALAYTLSRLSVMNGPEILELIQSRRAGSLNNPVFAKYVSELR